MNFQTPKKDPTALVLHIWKRINLPQIAKKDLIYDLSFKLFLMNPEKAALFINKSLKNGLLKTNTDNSLSLSDDLQKQLQKWQLKRKNQIRKKEEALNEEKRVLKDLKNNQSSNFNILLKTFLDKSTINRAGSVSDDSFHFKTFNTNNGEIITEVDGSKNNIYNLTINKNGKTIKHDCHDYVERKSRNKKFCKHLGKLFLIIKEKDKDFAIDLLNDLAESINEWNFKT